MAHYVVRRLEQSVVVVVGVTLIVFALTRLLPGGPARAILGPRASQGAIEQFDRANGYTLPVWDQYVRWLGQLVRGDLGYSYKFSEPVSTLLAQNLPKSALLVGGATVVALVVGIALGVAQAYWHGSVLRDHGPAALAMLLYSMPVFWLALLLVSWFALDLRWLPPEAPQGNSVGAILAHPSGLVLPIASLTLVELALFSRYVRAATLENLSLDYVVAARAKGLRERQVVLGHVLRNSLSSVVSVLGLMIPGILSGALLVEAVFNYPGMGFLIWNAAVNRDYPILLGFTVVIAVVTVLANLFADLVNALLDPRVRTA
jgi:peptide/nickel transport system permease protein